MAKTRRARIDAENDHRRVTKSNLQNIKAETQGYPTSYLRASSDTIQHGPESRKLGCETSFFLGSLWINDGGVGDAAISDGVGKELCC